MAAPKRIHKTQKIFPQISRSNIRKNIIPITAKRHSVRKIPALMLLALRNCIKSDSIYVTPTERDDSWASRLYYLCALILYIRIEKQVLVLYFHINTSTRRSRHAAHAHIMSDFKLQFDPFTSRKWCLLMESYLYAADEPGGCALRTVPPKLLGHATEDLRNLNKFIMV